MRGTFHYLLNAVTVVGLSIAIILGMSPAFYSQWAGFLSICTIPTLVMLNIFVNAPMIEKGQFRTQPVKGIMLLAGAVLSGFLIAPLMLFVFQGGISTPSIVAMMFVIFSVVTMMWLTLVFEGWPGSLLTSCSWQKGLATLALAYVSAYFIYPLLFNFTSLELSSGALQGLFPAWPAIVFCITTLGVIFALGLLEHMPLGAFRRFPQPFSGLLTGIFVVAMSGFLMWTVTGWGKVNVVSFMVAGPISFLFGVFMVNDVSNGTAFAHISAPYRGLLRVMASAAMGALMYMGYTGAMGWIAPGQPVGAPTYTADLWLANSMLSITFPVILVYIHFFDGWPLTRFSIGGSRP